METQGHIAKMQGMLDQAWMGLDSRLADLQRIALEMVTQNDQRSDETLIRSAVGMVVAELYHRRSQRHDK